MPSQNCRGGSARGRIHHQSILFLTLALPLPPGATKVPVRAWARKGSGCNSGVGRVAAGKGGGQKDHEYVPLFEGLFVPWQIARLARTTPKKGPNTRHLETRAWQRPDRSGAVLRHAEMLDAGCNWARTWMPPPPFDEGPGGSILQGLGCLNDHCSRQA